MYKIRTPKRRMYCERLIDGQWTAIRNNGEIAFRDEELNSFNNTCIEELYNIATAWVNCTANILGAELKSLLSADANLTTLRLSELNLFIEKSVEGMYGAVTLEVIRNTQEDNCPSREEFELALNGYAELKMIEKDILDMLGGRPEYIDYSDIRIVWAEQR